MKKLDTINENEKTFYNKINRMKTMKKRKENNITPTEDKSEREHSNKFKYDILISKNIEKNQQNLNNHEEYFEGFFNDIILKRKLNKNNHKDEEGIKRKKSFDKQQIIIK